MSLISHIPGVFWSTVQIVDSGERFRFGKAMLRKSLQPHLPDPSLGPQQLLVIKI